MGTGSVRRLALAIGALAFATLSAPALAQTQVVPSDPVLENPIKKVQKLVNDVTEKADEVVTETTETVDYVVDETVEDADQVVDHVRDEIDDVADGVLGGSPRVHPGPRVNEDKPKRMSTRPRTGPRAADVAHLSMERVSTPVASSASFQPGAALSTRAADFSAPVAKGPTAPVSPSQAARSLAFPLLMIVAVVGYLSFQGRFDRRDPKLLFHVDLDGERLSFE
jgi:hypothetical protein